MARDLPSALRQARDDWLKPRRRDFRLFMHDRILPGEARGAVEPPRIVVVAHGHEHPFLGKVAEGVGFDEVADLVDATARWR